MVPIIKCLLKFRMKGCKIWPTIQFNPSPLSKLHLKKFYPKIHAQFYFISTLINKITDNGCYLAIVLTFNRTQYTLYPRYINVSTIHVQCMNGHGLLLGFSVVVILFSMMNRRYWNSNYVKRYNIFYRRLWKSYF